MDIKEWIIEQQAAGYSDEQIKEVMAQYGYTAQDLVRYFPAPLTPQQQPRSSPTPRSQSIDKRYVYGGVGAALIVAALAVVTLTLILFGDEEPQTSFSPPPIQSGEPQETSSAPTTTQPVIPTPSNPTSNTPQCGGLNQKCCASDVCSTGYVCYKETLNTQVTLSSVCKVSQNAALQGTSSGSGGGDGGGGSSSSSSSSSTSTTTGSTQQPSTAPSTPVVTDNSGETVEPLPGPADDNAGTALDTLFAPRSG